MSLLWASTFLFWLSSANLSHEAFSFSEHLTILITALLATLAGTGLTLWILAGLLQPVQNISDALSTYKAEHKTPALPTHYNDEVGLLMADIQHFVYFVCEMDQTISMKNDLISVISHDARSPLSSITMGIDLIRDEIEELEIENEFIKQNLEMIRQSAKNQKKILENLLSLVKLEADEFKVIPERVDPNDLIEEVAENHHIQANMKGVNLELYPSDKEGAIMIDSVKIKSVLNNLVSNALKFTPPEGTVSLSAHKKPQQVTFEVSDNGTGITESNIDKIFQRPLHQILSHQKTSGSGIGLWICKKFTALHGGNITVDSEHQKGTTFTVSIPAD